MAKKKYSREFLISELQRLARELGRSPSDTDMKKADGFPGCGVYYKAFGSWNKAKEAAGLELSEKKGWSGGIFIERKMFDPLEHPFEFGYVYGVLLGDGCFLKNAVGLNTKDMDFIECFKENAERLTGYPCSKIGYVEGKWMTFPSGHYGYSKPVHTVRIVHRGFVDWLRKDDEQDGWKIYAEQYLDFARGFLKGFFDSEGNVHCAKRKYGYKYYIQMHVTDKELLESIQKIMKKLMGIEKGKISVDIRNWRKKPLYDLRFGYSEDFIKFYDVIGITITRKRPAPEVIAYIRNTTERLRKVADAYELVRTLVKEGYSGGQVWKKLKEAGHDISRGTVDGWVYQRSKRGGRKYRPYAFIHNPEIKLERGVLQRSCADCGTDISVRRYNSTLCIACFKKRRKAYLDVA